VLDRHRQRLEVASVGFDDFAELAPQGPYATGIRLPAAAGFTYRVLLGAVDLGPGDRLVGIRQMLEIAAVIGSGEGGGDAPFYPEVRPVVTPGWRFSDGQVVWTLTVEPATTRSFALTQGPFDQASFVYADADTAALVYETAHFPVGPPTAPGYLGLDGYSPPAMRGTPIYSMRDIRNRWEFPLFDVIRDWARAPARYRFYADVTQTSAQARTTITVPTTSAAAPFIASGLAPEESFIQLYDGTRYFRVAGSLDTVRG